MHRERIHIIQSDKRLQGCCCCCCFPSGPSNRGIMHRQPSIGVLGRDWRSAVQFLFCAFSLQQCSRGPFTGRWRWRGLDSRNSLVSQVERLFHWHILHFCGFRVGFVSKQTSRHIPTHCVKQRKSLHQQTKKVKQKYIQGERIQIFLVKIRGGFPLKQQHLLFASCTHTSTRT